MMMSEIYKNPNISNIILDSSIHEEIWFNSWLYFLDHKCRAYSFTTVKPFLISGGFYCFCSVKDWGYYHLTQFDSQREEESLLKVRVFFVGINFHTKIQFKGMITTPPHPSKKWPYLLSKLWRRWGRRSGKRRRTGWGMLWRQRLEIQRRIQGMEEEGLLGKRWWAVPRLW